MVVPVVVVEMAAGDQVPVIPSMDVAGSDGALLFSHNGPMATNVGVTSGVTFISSVAGMAHCVGSSGVKV